MEAEAALFVFNPDTWCDASGFLGDGGELTSDVWCDVGRADGTVAARGVRPRSGQSSWTTAATSFPSVVCKKLTGLPEITATLWNRPASEMRERSASGVACAICGSSTMSAIVPSKSQQTTVAEGSRARVSTSDGHRVVTGCGGVARRRGTSRGAVLLFDAEVAR